jgi:hypothetical protein
MGFDLVEDDTGTVLQGTVRNRKPRTIVNLTDATVVLRWTIDGGTPVQKDMTIVDASAGRVSYQFGAGDLVVPTGEQSQMRLNVVVIDSEGKVTTQPKPITYTIRKKI